MTGTRISFSSGSHFALIHESFHQLPWCNLEIVDTAGLFLQLKGSAAFGRDNEQMFFPPEEERNDVVIQSITQRESNVCVRVRRSKLSAEIHRLGTDVDTSYFKTGVARTLGEGSR